MFREESTFDPATAVVSDWLMAQAPAAPVQPLAARASALADAFAEEETGAVAHLYREIARRIPRNAFTPHASMLVERLG
jgi:hypothetical protein